MSRDAQQELLGNVVELYGKPIPADCVPGLREPVETRSSIVKLHSKVILFTVRCSCGHATRVAGGVLLVLESLNACRDRRAG